MPLSVFLITCYVCFHALDHFLVRDVCEICNQSIKSSNAFACKFFYNLLQRLKTADYQKSYVLSVLFIFKCAASREKQSPKAKTFVLLLESIYMQFSQHSAILQTIPEKCSADLEQLVHTMFILQK